MKLEKLHVLPNHIKVEDGYAYDEKYIGRVYEHDGKVIYFKEKSVIDFPLELFNAVENAIVAEITPSLVKLIDEIKLDFDLKLKSITEKIEESVLLFENNKETFNSIQFSEIDKLKVEIDNIKKSTVSKQSLDDVIDIKLTDVYKNFNDVTMQLVKSAVAEGLKDSKRDQTGKLKMTSLIMLKELGMSAEEIRSLADSGLI